MLQVNRLCGFGVGAHEMPLFGPADVGVIFDATDLSTLFQDILGTVPAVVNAPVLLMKDISRAHPNAIALGAELVTNGGFGADTDWTKGAGWTIAGGVAVAAAPAFGQDLTQTLALTIGHFYLIEFDVVRTSGTLTVFLGTAGVGGSLKGVTTDAVTVTGHYGFFATRMAGDVDSQIVFRSHSSFVGTIDNVTVKRLTNFDNHAFSTLMQPAATLRGTPILRGTPTGPNLVTNSDFGSDLAGWTDISSSGGIVHWSPLADGCAVFSTHGLDFATLTQAIATDIGQLYQLRWENVAGRVSSRVGVGTASGVIDIAEGNALEFWFTATGATTWLTIIKGPQNDWMMIKNVSIKKADAANVAAPYFLQGNGGVGQLSVLMMTFPLDFSATDKLTSIYGVRSNASGGIFTLTSIYTNPGSFLDYSSGVASGDVLWTAKGATGGAANSLFRSSPGNLLSPHIPHIPYDIVASGVRDMAGAANADKIKPRLNGYEPVITDTFGPAGTGNFANDFLYLFGLGTTPTFAGHFARGLVIGRALTAAEVLSREGWAFDGLQVSYMPNITSHGGGSSAGISAFENYTEVTTVQALGRGVLTFDISGGADAALFTINAATGVLSFISAPDFDAPTDADTDNVYEVTVRAVGAFGMDTQALSITVLSTPETLADIVALYGGGAVGCVHLPSETASVWADTAGTTPAVIDGPVARLDDLSGLGITLLQSSATKRPIWRTDGTRYWLEYDGIDDVLQSAAAAVPMADHEVIVAYQQTGAAGCMVMVTGQSVGGFTGVTSGINPGATGKPRAFNRDDAGLVLQQGSDVAYLNADVVFGDRYVNSVQVIEANGVERIFLGSNAGDIGPERGRTLGTTTDNATAVGADVNFGGNTQFMAGRFYGDICRSPAFTPSQRAGAAALLKSLTGIAP